MIVWCSYCRRFLREKAPFDSPQFSHGLCIGCDARLERGEAVKTDTEVARGLSQRVLEAAASTDLSACRALVAEAIEVGLTIDAILVGLLQPALYQAGLAWEHGRMSVADEHRLTSWCERAFDLLPPVATPEPLELLILAAPGNTHTLGPRFAAEVLSARGISTRAVVPELPCAEIVALLSALQPRALGLSCALASQVPAALAVFDRLRAAPTHWSGRTVLSGFAFRLGATAAPPGLPDTVEVALDLEFFNA